MFLFPVAASEVLIVIGGVIINVIFEDNDLGRYGWLYNGIINKDDDIPRISIL